MFVGGATIEQWLTDPGAVDIRPTLDAMPAAPRSSASRTWQAAALPHAVKQDLPSGTTIRVASPPYLLAMKLEAFRGRGKGDFIASRDFEDIVTLLDRRPELIAELRSADAELRGFVAGEMQRLLGKAGFPDGVAAALPPDAASQGRAREVIRPAFEALSDLAADA